MSTELSNEWWAAIIHQFHAHLRDETRFLEKYEAAAAHADDRGTKFLLEIILADEHRHHELFEAMAAAARGDDGAVPLTVAPSSATARELLDATRRFSEAERDDERELKRLRDELAPLRDDTLWQLLVDVMMMDTRKHLVILGYLERRLRDAARED